MYQVTEQTQILAFLPFFTVSCCSQKVRQGVESPIKEEEVMDSFKWKAKTKRHPHDSPLTMKSSCYSPVQPGHSGGQRSLPLSVTHLLSNVAVAQPCLTSSFWL